MLSRVNLSRILFLVALAVYCTLVFWIVDSYTVNFWIIFVFTLISPIVAIISTFKKSNISGVQISTGVLLVRAMLIHFVGQLILHLILFIESFPTVLLAVLEIVFIAALFAYPLYFAKANVVLEQKISKQEKEVNYLSGVSGVLNDALRYVTDSQVKIALRNLVEKFGYSPYDSDQSTKAISMEITELTVDLATLAESNTASAEELLTKIKEIEMLLNKRNRLIRLSN